MEISKNPVWSQDQYIRAWHFAAHVHNGQNFPGTELPYLVHLSLVTMEVMSALHVSPGMDGNLAVQCALLHDTIEDTETEYSRIREEFGTPVDDGVLALSKDSRLEKALRMGDSLRRIRMQPKEIWMVKMADRITNLYHPPPCWSPEKISDYWNEAIVIYEALKTASAFLADRLNDKIEQYRKFL